MNALTRVVSVTTLALQVSLAWADAPSAPQAHPALQWNRIALEAIARAKPTQHQAVRVLAHVSLAQHDVMSDLGNEEAMPDAVATASARVIAALLPSQATFVAERRRELATTASAAGDRIAQRVIAEVQSDGFGTAWSGSLPHAAYAWKSLATPPAPPAYPAIGTMRTFLADSGSAFRVAPPPVIGSKQFLDDLAEVRHHVVSPNAESIRIAKFYDMTTGTLAGGFWNEQATELMHKHGLRDSRHITTVLAAVNTAMLDALIACHDAKYAYWVPRPSQADPLIAPLIGVPNHPSYPSNHSCLSTAAAGVLAHFFPQEAQKLQAIGVEAGVSRIYAGLHYRFDVHAGEEIGHKIAAVAIARHAQMLAARTRSLVSTGR